jgi:putative ABC transport system substrate-binding protein
MRRLILALLACLPIVALAQAWIHRIAVIEPQPSTANGANFSALRLGLRERGYVEGKNIAIGYRSADGEDERYPELCAEAVQHKVGLIIVHGTPAARACMQATGSIPILFFNVDDPVANGLVADAGRPGGNATGLMYASSPLVIEARVKLLREVFPDIARVAAMINLGKPELARQRREIESSGRDLGIAIRVFDVRSVPDLQTAFAQAANERLQAVYVPIDDLTEANMKLVAALGLKHRLPTLTAHSAFVEAGSLLSYGADTVAEYRRLAVIADRILTGAKPGEIPLERPVAFTLTVNLQTARKLRVRIPRQVLSRADRLIQ